jgi:hypothetical protein
VGRTDLAAAFHAAAASAHCSRSEQAATENKDQGRAYGLQLNQSCAAEDFIHSNLIYKMPQCAVNKKFGPITGIGSLYKIAYRIYIYWQLTPGWQE